MAFGRFTSILLIANLVFVALWLVLAKALLPQLVESAYRGERIPVLSRLVDPRLSIRQHLKRLHYVAWRLPLCVSGTSLIAWLLMFLAIKRRAKDQSNMSDAAVQEALRPMGRRRLVLAKIVIGALLGSTLLSIASTVEFWPISNYPMFSGACKGEGCQADVVTIRWYGIPIDSEEEFPFSDSVNYMRPFDWTRLRYIVVRLQARPGAAALLEQAARNCLALYETNRRAGVHDSPPLKGLRLYRITWDYDPTARNIEHPKSKELVYEIILDQPQG